MKKQDDQLSNNAVPLVAELSRANGFSTLLIAGNHQLIADEPIEAGGNDSGLSPYEFLSAGLAACTAMTLQLYARKKQWPLETVRVLTSFGRGHAGDCEHCEEDDARIDTFQRVLQLKGPLSADQKKRLLEIANKCPVHRTLIGQIKVLTTIGEIEAI